MVSPKGKRTKKAEVKVETPQNDMDISPIAVMEAEERELPRLTKEELLTLKVAELEAKLAHAKAGQAKMTRLYVLATIDPQGRIAKLEKELQQQEQIAKRHWAMYRQIMETAGQRLGVDLTKSSMDPNTGIITEIE